MPPAATFGKLAAVPEPEKPTSATPYRIAVLADFSGRANRGECGDSADVASRAPVVIHRDDFDDVLAGLGVRLSLPVPSKKSTEDVAFASLEEFEPDSLWDRTDPLIRKLADKAKQTEQMRAFLHDPHFQTVEGAWRGIDWLLRRVAKDDKVEIVLHDVSSEEFGKDLSANEDLSKSGVHDLLVRKATQGRKGKPWAMIVGIYTFEPCADHASLLGRMAKIARAACAPFVAAVDSKVLSEKFKAGEGDAEAWQAMRALPESAYIVLGASRFLVRQPYGAKNRKIEKFDFEEISSPPKPAEHPWGNPGLAAAALIAKGFMEKGWAAKPAATGALDKMAMHVHLDDGDLVATVTDAWIDRRHLATLAKAGYVPFVGVKDKDVIQPTAMQSIAAGPIAGRWDTSAGVAKAQSTRPSVNRPQMNVGATIAASDFAEPSKDAPSEPAAQAEAPAEETPPAETPPEEAPAEATASEDASPSGEAPAVSEPPAADAESAPSEAGDPELDALLKSLGGDAPAEEAAAEDAGDPELDALLKSLKK